MVMNTPKTKHTNTKIYEDSFMELKRIKEATGLSHGTVMKLIVECDVTVDDLLNKDFKQTTSEIHFVQITRECLDELKESNTLDTTLIKLLSLKIKKFGTKV